MKKILSIVLCIAILCGNVILVSANDIQKVLPDFIIVQTIDKSDGFLTINGILPDVSAMESVKLQAEITEKIHAFYIHETEKIHDDTTEITFDFDYFVYESTHTIYMKAIKKSPMNEENTLTICFDIENESLLNLEDVIDINAVKAINKYIARYIAKNPQNLKSTFVPIKNNHNFYIADGTLYLIFDKYMIAPDKEGIVEIPMPMQNFISIAVAQDEYRTTTAYNIKMIPLRIVVTEFGYTTKWDGIKREVTISLSDELITTFAIDKNLYKKEKSGTRVLEAAPEIKNSSTFVPVSFFDTILDLQYTQLPDKSILFSKYIDK